jgi:hypothetical protein
LAEFGELGAASPELFATPQTAAAAQPEAATLALVAPDDDVVSPATPDSDGDSEASNDTFVESDEGTAAEDDAAAEAALDEGVLAELKNEQLFRMICPFLCCRDENCKDFQCLQNIQHAREFPTGPAAKLLGSGINMYAVYMLMPRVRALGLRLRRPQLPRGSRQYQSAQRQYRRAVPPAVQLCAPPSVPRPEAPAVQRPQPRARDGVHRVPRLGHAGAPLPCDRVSRAPPPLDRAQQAHVRRRSRVQRPPGSRRAGHVGDCAGRREAIGGRKYHVGQSPRVNGLVWVVGAAKIDENTGKVTALSCSVVVKRDAAAIAQIVLPLLKNDAVLTTDKWRAYGKALKDAESAVVHHQVNHSVEFKSKDGHHTNHIEGMWRIVRKELKVRWSRCGTNDPTQQDNRVQFGVWVINHRLGSAETGIFQAMMVLLMNHDKSRPPPGTFDVSKVPQKDRQDFEDNVDEDGREE